MIAMTSLVWGVFVGAPSDAAGAIQSWLSRESARMVWQIGQFDGQAAEFGLALGQAREFAKRFGERVTFEVGRNSPSDFPFIHPSEKDTAWGGRPVVPFAIRFTMPDDAKGTHVLVLALTDTHEQFASTMEIVLNGRSVWKQRMPLGPGRAFFGDPHGEPRTFFVPLPAEQLHQGANEVVMTLEGGSWVSYDGLALVEWPRATWQPPAPPAMPAGTRTIPAGQFTAETGVIIPEKEGLHASLLPQGTLAAEGLTLAANDDLEFAFRPQSGECLLSYDLPGGARGALWQMAIAANQGTARVGLVQTSLSRTAVSEESTPADWLKVRIEHRATTTRINVQNRNGTLLDRPIFHPPAPTGVLRWRASDQVAEFDLAHVGWRPAVGPASESSTTASDPLMLTRGEVPTGPLLERRAETAEIRLLNGRLELVIATKGTPNPRQLGDLATGRLFADANYIWPAGQGPQLVGEPALQEGPGSSQTLTLTAKLDALEIEQTWTAPADEPGTLIERIRLKNTSDKPLDTSSFACGLAKRLNRGAKWFPDTAGDRVTPIPYRRDTVTGALCEWSLSELVWRLGAFNHSNPIENIWGSRVMTHSAHGSEAWAWCHPDSTLLIAKYNPAAMEWSLLEPAWIPDDHTHQPEMIMRLGGAGRWKLGEPSAAAQLKPGASFTFGATRYQVVDGGWKEATYAFRRWMERAGHVTPPGFDPPVHWNELYDNPFWGGPDTAERRAQLYRRADMLAEAEKAHELGCEALYLDPGWDTAMSSCIWAADRLGPQEEFARLIKEKYNLALALHTPLAGWSDVSAYPVEARRKDREGKRLDTLCGGSSVYFDTKVKRLLELAAKGAVYQMFDGTWYTGECWDESHGHSLPYTRQEQCDAYRRIVRAVHERYPTLLIEMHDPLVGGTDVRWTPTYFLHGSKGDFDDLWGYEYMWNVMNDLFSGRAITLYYANLAYSIPYYLHIDLRKDNTNAVQFWWFASTCRHLGVGGQHPDPAVWEAHKQAMRTYRSLKRFYTQGAFFGLDETVHAHTLASEKRTVVDIFNLADMAAEREIRFRLSDVGLPGRPARIEGAMSAVKDGDITLWPRVPGRGHLLVQVYAEP